MQLALNTPGTRPGIITKNDTRLVCAGKSVRPPLRGNPGDLGRLQTGGGRDVEAIDRVLKLVAQFEHDEARRPRILVAKVGQDGHDRGQR